MIGALLTRVGSGCYLIYVSVIILYMERWSGRVALVTGASTGIGAGIATALVKNGMIVIGVARDVDRIKVSVFFSFHSVNE